MFKQILAKLNVMLFFYYLIYLFCVYETKTQGRERFWFTSTGIEFHKGKAWVEFF